jgi:hypothetical protein
VPAAGAGEVLLGVDAAAGLVGLLASGSEVLVHATRLKVRDAHSSVVKTKWAGKRAAKFMLYKS